MYDRETPGYPLLTINLAHLKHNVEVVEKKCSALGISLAAVVKGASSNIEMAKVEASCDVKWLCTSRVDQIVEMQQAGIKTPMMLIRIPMLSEADQVVKYADTSLNSERQVLVALNEAAKKQGKIHNVIIMKDVGDLREGIFDEEDFIDTCVFVEKELKHLHLLGTGTNVCCISGIIPTVDKMEELISVTEKVEAKIGRQVEVISGGASSSLMRVWDNNMPKRINNLRVGEEILNAYDLKNAYHYDTSELYDDVFKLEAEVIEVKKKPTLPQGEVGVDAFGHVPHFDDLGERKRLTIALGRYDYAFLDDLECQLEGVKPYAASSDHTKIDYEDSKYEFKVGDIIPFTVRYGPMMFLTNSPNVHIKYIR